MSNKITVIIPMAGRGKRFIEAGYSLPKPFIPVLGKPMIQHILENIPDEYSKIVITLREFMSYSTPSLFSGVKLHLLNKETKGPADTIFQGGDHIDKESHILCIDSDTLIEYPFIDIVDECIENDCDAGVLTFKTNPDYKHSYARGHPFVTETAEKVAISNYAICGVYYFKNWKVFSDAFNQMKERKDTYRGEYYLSSAYNHLNCKIRNICVARDYIHSWGTPESLEFWLKEYLDRTKR